MTRISIPKPSYLDEMESLGFIHGSRRWRSPCGRRLYTWDEFHGEIEVKTEGVKSLIFGYSLFFDFQVKNRNRS